MNESPVRGRSIALPTEESRPQHVKVVIVDDDRLFADLVGWALQEGGHEVAGVASGATEGVRIATESQPDVVLMDVVLPDGDGISAGRTIVETMPDTAVIALSGIVDRDTMSEALRTGFRDYVPKNSSLSQLVSRIEAAASGDGNGTAKPSRTIDIRSNEDPHAAMLIRTLTRREREILGLIADGVGGPGIAEMLGLSRNTVRTHVQNILTKLQVGSRLEAAAFAERHGLVRSLNRPGSHASA